VVVRFDHVLINPRDPQALALSILRLAHAGRPRRRRPTSQRDFTLLHASAAGLIADGQLVLSRANRG
jgi:hypothetical protein